MTQDIHNERILIIDFGSQYTQLIARRVREIGVYCDIVPYTVDVGTVTRIPIKGIILSGSPESVHTKSRRRIPKGIMALQVPVLGICYGMQAMVSELGGQVNPALEREYGFARITCLGAASRLFAGIEDHTNNSGQAELDVWMSHGDRVDLLPPGFSAVAWTANAPFAAVSDEARGFYGLQFHPEVTHTPQGKRLLERFVLEICNVQALWRPGNILEDRIQFIQDKVGQDQVILGLSGGVDSSVVAALMHKAIGKQLICIFVDTGLLRLHESERVMATMAKHMGVKVILVEAASRYFAALQGVRDPERKRKIIGNLFIDIFEEQAKKLSGVQWLAQGTIYSDVIESAGHTEGGAHVIKSHHNVGGLPETMQLTLIEPLRELFKDEVRQLGLALGLPHDMLFCHPFPGPGLGVRILGEVTLAFADLLRQADAIFLEELHRHHLYSKVSQAFAVFLPIKSVGVMGDQRAYGYVIALRAVESTDFMTAHWAALPHDFLSLVSNRIINEVKGITRVTYDISGKPPATIEWE